MSDTTKKNSESDLPEYKTEINDSKKVFFLITVMIMIIGIVLRAAIIDVPLWYDEACTLLVSREAFPFGINDFLWNNELQHMPFYFYIMHFWVALFGDSDVTLRISSLIPALFTIPLTYIVAKKLTNKTIGLIAMFLMSINVFQVYYATEVRMYTLILLFSLMSINYLIDFDKNSDKKSLVKLIIINTLIPYTLTGAIVFPVAELICYSAYLFIKKAPKEKIINYALSNVALMLLLIPYFVWAFHYISVRSTFLVTHTTPFAFVNLIGVIQNFLAPDAGTLLWSTYASYTIDFKTFLLLIVPLIYMIRGIVEGIKSKNELVYVITGTLILSFVAVVLSAVNQTIVLAARYLIFVSPFLLILAAIGLYKLQKWHWALFLAFYFCAGAFYISDNKAFVNIKDYALNKPAELIQALKLGKNDVVIMPFGSSVAFHYTNGENAPAIPTFEAIQEFRQSENINVYSSEQIELFKTVDKIDIFQSIIMNDNFISENFYNYLKSMVDMANSGGYILLVLYGPDITAFIPPSEYKQIYKNKEILKNNLIGGIMSKFYFDIQRIIESEAVFVKSYADYSNRYFLYKKK